MSGAVVPRKPPRMPAGPPLPWGGPGAPDVAGAQAPAVSVVASVAASGWAVAGSAVASSG